MGGSLFVREEDKMHCQRSKTVVLSRFVVLLARRVESCWSNREPLGEDDFGVIILLNALKSRVVISKDASCLVRGQSFVTDCNGGAYSQIIIQKRIKLMTPTVVSVRPIRRILWFDFLVRNNVGHGTAEFLTLLLVLRRVFIPCNDVQNIASFAANVERALVITHAVDFPQWE